MSDKTPEHKKRPSELDNPQNIDINFSDYPELTIKGQEIKNCLLTGEYGENHKIRPANIVLSKMENFISKNGLMEYVDYKDSEVRETKFIDTSFDFAAFINSDFNQVIFERCKFHNVSITGTSFKSVKFVDCNIEHMVIESCRFTDCEFSNCSTSNKLFDYCLFSNTTFVQTDIQIQTIVNNFGLTKEALNDCKIRDRSTGEEYEFLNIKTLNNAHTNTILESFKLKYFLDAPSVLEGDDIFDKTFELESWIKTAKIQLTFTNLISFYYEFLVDLYENNICSIFPLIKLHSLTGLIIGNRALDQSSLTTINGLHMNLARQVEDFLSLLFMKVNSLSNPIIFLAIGPLTKTYYQNQLSSFFENSDLIITKVKKRNSPNELFIAWQTISDVVPLIAVFLASRFKLEFTKIAGNNPSGETGQSKNLAGADKAPQSLVPIQKNFELQIGLDEKMGHLYGLKLKSIFPGQLLMELGLHISIKKVQAIKKILIDLLKESD